MGFKLLSLGSRWFIRIFFFEIDPPPKKKTRKSRKNCRANLSLKKVMVQPIFTWLQPFGPVKITPKTPAPNRPIVRPLRIWNSELPSYLREIFWTKIHPRWPTRKSRGNLKWKNKKIQQPGPSSFEMPEQNVSGEQAVNSPWHLRGFPLATQLEGAGLQNYTLAPCLLLPAVHSRQKEKKQKEGDTYHLGCSRHRIHHSDHFYLRLGDHNFNPHFHHWHLARRNSHMPKFVPSEKYSHVDMLFPGGVKMTKEYKRPLKPPFIVDMLNVLGCSPFLRSIFLLTTQWLPFHHFCPRIRFSHPSL